MSARQQMQKDCRQCAHHRPSYADSLLCVGDIQAKPVETVRHFRGRCGIEGKLFKPLKAAKGKKPC